MNIGAIARRAGVSRSATDGAAILQWTCNGGTNQQFTLRKVTYSGNDSHDHQLVARHSGKRVDVSEVSTAARAAVHQRTCNNQTWRLWGR